MQRIAAQLGTQLTFVKERPVFDAALLDKMGQGETIHGHPPSGGWQASELLRVCTGNPPGGNFRTCPVGSTSNLHLEIREARQDLAQHLRRFVRIDIGPPFFSRGCWPALISGLAHNECCCGEDPNEDQDRIDGLPLHGFQMPPSPGTLSESDATVLRCGAISYLSILSLRFGWAKINPPFARFFSLVAGVP